MMRRLLVGFAAAGIAFAAVGASAAEDPIDVRQKIMTSVGRAGGLLFGMVQGKSEFDARSAGLALSTLQAASATFGDYFPAGSESGEHTCAGAKIWEDRAGFDAVVGQFAERSSAAFSAAPKDVESLKVAIGPVFEMCGECHKAYRQSEDYSTRC